MPQQAAVNLTDDADAASTLAPTVALKEIQYQYANDSDARANIQLINGERAQADQDPSAAALWFNQALPLIEKHLPGLLSSHRVRLARLHRPLVRLSAIPQIIGVKDSSGDMEYFALAIGQKKKRPNWSIMVGPEAMLPEAMRLGGDGGVAGGVNVFPKLFVACYQACVAKDQARIQERQAAIDALQQIYTIGKYTSRYIKATKSCLSLLGICDDFLAELFHRFNPPERERVQAVLHSLNSQIATLR